MKSCLVALCLLVFLSPCARAVDGAPVQQEDRVLTEDTVWRGSVLIKGSVVVAPQTTLRIEPGTTIRFSAANAAHVLPQLLVQGRIQAIGTAERPIIMTSDRSRAERGDWGGIVLLNTEKRNALEYCRIEYAETGVSLHFSALSLKMISIVRARTALRARDSMLEISGGTLAESEIGIETHDSELEARDLTVRSCRRGCLLYRTAVQFLAVRIRQSELVGLTAVDCHLKISGGEVSGNAQGAVISGGEGHILMTGFTRNVQTALHLSGSRLKIQRCRFEENSQDAVQSEDGRVLLLNNSFRSNGGYNLQHSGSEELNAPLNWWGSAAAAEILLKIHTAATPGNGVVRLFPWLQERPPLQQ